jgi:hypothetical protein
VTGRRHIAGGFRQPGSKGPEQVADGQAQPDDVALLALMALQDAINETLGK